MKCNDFLLTLNAERSNDAEVLKKPHMAGISHLLANKIYPDTAHFIYELLQNAEDVQATEIMFHLTPEKLMAEHNGQPFTKENIDAITSIPEESHKVNKIGQHGLGFKSVFGYTNTPHIYSGKFAFKIRDLIVPEPITPLNEQTSTTIFEFPFNNSKKLPTEAFNEIADGFRDLSTTTLLFLANIKVINWTCADELASYTRLHTHSEHHVEIEACVNGEVTNGTHYLRFMAKIPDKPEHLQVGLAYSLDFNKGTKSFDTTKPLTEQMRVKNETGLVSIFFPAKNATSNLSFHIHAPFATVPGRNSISDTSEVASTNEELIAAIAQLAISSLHDIKAMGLLNRAFLDVLPHDKIPAFYQPISEQIWAALRTQSLIPTYSGDFAAGEQLYHATDDKDDKLKKLLDSGDLAHLENRTDEILDWCLDVPEALRSKIDIKAINTKQFIDKLINPPFTLSHWLELKENTWMQQLYSYLQPHNLQLKQTPLVRLNDGSHVLASKAYFPSDGIVDDKDFPRVCAATYESGNEEQQEEREQAREFLKNIGVNEVTEREKIELIIKKWKDKNPSNEEYLAHLRQFIDYFKKDRNISIFSDKHIFWGDSKDGKIFRCTAKQLFIDSPLRETGITSWFLDEPNYYLLSKKYANLTSLNVDDLVDFAKDLGARVSTEVTCGDIQTILSRWKTTKPNETEYLKFLPQFISSRNHALFKDQAIFWGDSTDDKTDWYAAKQLFIDSPLRETGITAFFEDLPNYFLLSKKYSDLPSFNIDDLVDFAGRLGAKIDTEVTHEDIQNILSLWETTKPTDADYLKYLPKFIAFSDHDLFKNRAIFWGDTKNGETKLVKTSEIFIDSPLQDTSISTWYADKDNYYLLSTKYAEHISLDISALVDFAKKLGAKDRLPIIQIRASSQRLYNQYYTDELSTKFTRHYGSIDEDWCIAINENDESGLEQWLKNPSETKFFSIWMTMNDTNTKKEMLTACYKRYAKCYNVVKRRDSRLVYALKTAAWIPQLNETSSPTFVTPAKAIPDLLPENFKYNDDNGWLTAIEFGKEEEARAAERQRQIERESHTYQVKVNTAKDNGFDSPEEMAEAAALVKEAKIQGKSVAELRADFTRNNSPELPEETVPNPERRRQGVLERSDNAPRKESVMRERSVQLGTEAVVEDSKAYLRTKYTTTNCELVCQCCQQEMPFKIGDAYYFEAVQCVKTIENHYIENRLALCPTCAAMYQHARATDDTEIRRLIVEHEAPDDASSVEIPLTLANQPYRLRFVGTHFFDLKTVLAKQ